MGVCVIFISSPYIIVHFSQIAKESINFDFWGVLNKAPLFLILVLVLQMLIQNDSTDFCPLVRYLKYQLLHCHFSLHIEIQYCIYMDYGL